MLYKQQQQTQGPEHGTRYLVLVALLSQLTVESRLVSVIRSNFTFFKILVCIISIIITLINVHYILNVCSYSLSTLLDLILLELPSFKHPWDTPIFKALLINQPDRVSLLLCRSLVSDIEDLLPLPQAASRDLELRLVERLVRVESVAVGRPEHVSVEVLLRLPCRAVPFLTVTLVATGTPL